MPRGMSQWLVDVFLHWLCGSKNGSGSPGLACDRVVGGGSQPEQSQRDRNGAAGLGLLRRREGGNGVGFHQGMFSWEATTQKL